ncbi:MAG TPA: ComEA family DNA-binding protein [Patescibacteria group bacterium]|nr:ComEA family DNA-binding protein [Patescibacteria group bacterium]
MLGNSTVENSPESSASLKIEIDVSGEVVNPGVYELDFGSRVEDALQKAGGITDNADKNWVDKNINKAAKLTDGQKIYIPSLQQSNNDIASSNEQNSSVAQSESGQININTASLGELESLEGIGQVYGQKIIDNRPYSAVEELLSKSVLKQSEYNKIKDRLIVY